MSKLTRSLSIALVLATSAIVATAQSGVLFIPSTSTQDKGTFHLSLETYHHFDRYKKGGFQSYGPAMVYGLSKNVEAGLNYYSTRNADGWAHHIEPHIKWKVYEKEESGTAVAFGMLAFVP